MDRIVAASTAPLLYCSNALYFCRAKIWWQAKTNTKNRTVDQWTAFFALSIVPISNAQMLYIFALQKYGGPTWIRTTTVRKTRVKEKPSNPV